MVSSGFVFLALRGEEGHAECAWPIPLELPAMQGPGSIQLRLIADDGYEGPARDYAMFYGVTPTRTNPPFWVTNRLSR